MNKINLNTGWNYSLAGDSKTSNDNPNKVIRAEKWFPATVPGTIHTDLLGNKLVDDPYYSNNETKLEWITKQDWIYKTEFEFNPVKGKKYNLIFEGIDTIADVYLNGSKVASTKNMFLSYKININKFIKSGKNEVKVYFHSPVNYAVKQEEKYGRLPVELNSYRAYIRKAQYSFGWDWGPSFPTSGIWRNVYIEEEAPTLIESTFFDTLSLSKSNANAKVRVKAKIKCDNNSKKLLVVQLGELKKEINITGSNIYEIELGIKEPKLWWPNREGKQNLYELKLTLYDKKGEQLNSVEKKVGIRTIELITEEKKDNTFKLRVNGRDVFAKGVNWIPADSFLPRVDKSKYSKLLTYAKDANMNIIRDWGGGVYEDDYFYELCDELGLLVWQDFMFACGSYPEQKEFINSVKEEVEQNVTRLQHHASIALWCGNNENEWIWHQKYEGHYKEMPGYKIYHDVIPTILKKIDPMRPYHPSSPFGWDEDPNSFNSGNTHQWKIWSMWVDYEQVKNDRSFFVTEFGFQGPANKDTFEKVIPNENRKIHDRIFEFHNKQVEGPERIWRFLTAHLPVTTQWDDYLYMAQLNQGFALKTCLEHWRTNGRTNGSLIWQINDSWPVTSWAIIDYDLKPKLAYHFVKNIFAPQIIYFYKNDNKVEVKIQNYAEENFKGSYKLFFVKTSSGEIVKQFTGKIYANGKGTLVLDLPLTKYISDNVIIYTQLFNSDGEELNTNYFKTQPWKYYKFVDAGISVNLVNKDGRKQIEVTSNKPVFFVDLYAEGIEFDKRGFTIMNGEKVTINIANNNSAALAADKINVYSLNQYLSGE